MGRVEHLEAKNLSRNKAYPSRTGIHMVDFNQSRLAPTDQNSETRLPPELS